MERTWSNAGQHFLRLGVAMLGILFVLLFTQYILLVRPPPISREPGQVSFLRPESRPVVPRIVHYTWYSMHRHTFRFHHLLSLMSARKFLRPEKIYFWCASTPRGRWWQEALQRVPELHVRLFPAPTQVFGRPVRIPEHQSDIVRLEAILEYGGIYLDLDVLVLRSFESLLHYNVTMGYQLDQRDLCNGIIVARPGDQFINLWYGEYRYFLDRKWDYHSVRLPDVLAKRYPHMIHIEKRTFHRPNFNERKWIYDKDHIYPWRQNFAMHLWYRFYNVDHTPQDIKQLNSTLGQMFRYIYYGSS